MAKSKNGKSKAPREASTYRHPEADSPLRPDVGTQPQFKKRKPPVTYRYGFLTSPPNPPLKLLPPLTSAFASGAKPNPKNSISLSSSCSPLPLFATSFSPTRKTSRS